MPLQNLLILRNIVILSAIIILNDLVRPPPHAVSGAVNITTLFGNMSFAVLPPDFECLAYESHTQRPYVSVEIHPFPSPFSTGTPLVWARDWAPRFPIRGQGSKSPGGGQARPAPLPPPPVAIGGPSFSSSSYLVRFLFPLFVVSNLPSTDRRRPEQTTAGDDDLPQLVAALLHRRHLGRRRHRRPRRDLPLRRQGTPPCLPLPYFAEPPLVPPFPVSRLRWSCVVPCSVRFPVLDLLL